MFDLESFKETDAKNLNPQVLAFVGDGVYSLYIRNKIVLEKQIKGKDLHNEVTTYVKAKGQSDFIEKILPILTAEEVAIFRRARNHKTLSQAKNANIIDYRRATGLEAVIGYLYLSANFERLNHILGFIGEKSEN